MGQVSGLNRRRSQQLSPSLRAEMFDVATKDGHSYVGIKFEQRLPSGGAREFRTDLEHLEHIEKRVAEYAASGDDSERHEQVGDIHVWMKRGFYPDRGDAVGVQLFQQARDGSGEEQRLRTYADSLKRTVNHGQELERELGYDQRWHVLVDASSLTKDENGRVHAEAVKSFDSETKAREHLGKSSGLALYSEPQRREFSKGDTVELWTDATTLERGRHDPKTVEQQLDQAEWSRGRDGEHFIVAKWDDVLRNPSIGQRASVGGNAYAYNGEPQDFRAGPLGGKDQGERDTPLWVLIEKDDQKFGRGVIRGISADRKEMTDELTRQEEIQQAVGREWEQQSFGMDRNQFKQDQSM